MSRDEIIAAYFAINFTKDEAVAFTDVLLGGGSAEGDPYQSTAIPSPTGGGGSL